MFNFFDLTHPHTVVLVDLPLPTALPTAIEKSMMGATKKLSAEARRLLDTTNQTICSKVADTLLSIDMGFL